MNIHMIVTLSIIAILSCLPYTGVAFGQTPSPRVPMPATAHIPYDFWIAGTLLPAGDYFVSPGAPSVVVFWSEKDDIGEQAFLIPTGDPVASGDCKLIFVLRNGQHYLRAIWYLDGQAILTSEFDLPLAAGDTETDVKLLEQKHDSKLVQTRE